jgi:hypothetical protein
MFRRGTLADTVPELKHCVVRALSISLPPLSAQLFEEVGGTDSMPGVKQLFDEVGLNPLQQLQRFVPLLKCKARVWLQAIGNKSITLGHAIVTSRQAVADARVKNQRTGTLDDEPSGISGGSSGEGSGSKGSNDGSSGSSEGTPDPPSQVDLPQQIFADEIELGIGFSTLVALDREGRTMPIPQHQRLHTLCRPRSHQHMPYIVWPPHEHDVDPSPTPSSPGVSAIREAAATARPPWLELLHKVPACHLSQHAICRSMCSLVSSFLQHPTSFCNTPHPSATSLIFLPAISYILLPW